MNTFAEYSRRILLFALFGVVTVVVLALVTRYVILHDTKTVASLALPSAKTAALVPQSTDSQSMPAYLVPASRIPKTQVARVSAPAITLVAGDWQQDPSPQGGPGHDQAAIPLADRRLMAEDVQSFLQAWETFSPPGDNLRGPSSSTTAAYATAVDQWTNPANSDDVVNRVDNRQPPQVCPSPGCMTGSSWAGGDVWDMMNVRYYDGQQAYVTVNGFVRYQDVIGSDGLDGTVWERSYGLLLEKLTNRWLVDRAAADTISRVSLGG